MKSRSAKTNSGITSSLPFIFDGDLFSSENTNEIFTKNTREKGDKGEKGEKGSKLIAWIVGDPKNAHPYKTWNGNKVAVGAYFTATRLKRPLTPKLANVFRAAQKLDQLQLAQPLPSGIPNSAFMKRSYIQPTLQHSSNTNPPLRNVSASVPNLHHLPRPTTQIHRAHKLQHTRSAARHLNEIEHSTHNNGV